MTNCFQRIKQHATNFSNDSEITKKSQVFQTSVVLFWMGSAIVKINFANDTKCQVVECFSHLFFYLFIFIFPDTFTRISKYKEELNGT